MNGTEVIEQTLLKRLQWLNIMCCPCSNNVESTKKQTKPDRRRDSFQDFEAKTIDAWDDGDDDLLKMASTIKSSSAQRRGPAGISSHSVELDGDCTPACSSVSKSQNLKTVQHISSTSGKDCCVMFDN